MSKLSNADVDVSTLSQEELDRQIIAAARELTPSHRKFCDGFLVYFNSARAAREAGYSEKRCATTGYQLMRRTDVKRYIALKTAGWMKRIDAEAIEVLQGFADIAKSSPTDIMDIVDYEIWAKDDEGNDYLKEIQSVAKLKPSDEWPEHAKNAVREVRSTREGPVVKMYSRDDALANLARYHKLFADITVDQNVNLTGGVAIVPGVEKEDDWKEKFGQKPKEIESNELH